MVVSTGDALALAGRLDMQHAAEVREALHRALDAGTGDLVLDVSGVELVDATGLGVLMGAHRRAQERDRRLVLRGVEPRMLRILRLTRLHRVFAVEPASPV